MRTLVLTLALLALPALALAQQSHLQWQITPNQMTPYIVDQHPDGSRTVTNLDNGDLGYHSGNVTQRFNSRPDPVMDDLLNQPQRQVEEQGSEGDGE